MQCFQKLQALLGSRLNDHSYEGDVFTDSHSQPVFASAAATHEMRLMNLALHAKEVKASLMAEVVEQAMYDQLRVETHAQLDLTQHSCAPDAHPVTGDPLFSFEDVTNARVFTLLGGAKNTPYRGRKILSIDTSEEECNEIFQY